MPHLRRSSLWAALVLLAVSFSAGDAGATPGLPGVQVLSNGLKVITLEDHTVPLVAVSLWVHSGSKNEIESSAGYAHFLEHLVQAGTKEKKTPFEYSRLANRWGGKLVARSNYDRTHITITGIPSALEDLVRAAADMAYGAIMEDPEIDRQLGALTQEIKTYYDDPVSVAFLETMRATFPEHPYRVPMLGNFRTLGRLKHDPIHAFYRNLYVPNNMALVLAGDLRPAQAAEFVRASFGRLRKSATLPPPPDPPSGFPGHRDVEKRLELKESWTNISFAGPGFRHPDRPAVEVLARALADVSVVRLHQALARGQTGSSARVSYYGLEDAGMLYIAIKPSTPQLSYAAATAALEAIATFKTRGLREDQLKSIVDRLLLDERMQAEHLATRAERLGEAALFGGIRYYWDLPREYARLTTADIGRVASKYLIEENLRLVVIVPEQTAAFPEEPQARFHRAVDKLGKARPGAAPGHKARRHADSEASRIQSDAWGNWRDAGRPMSPTRSVLDNGLTVVVQSDRRHSLAAVALFLRFGSGDDPPDRGGLASIVGRLIARGASAGAPRPGEGTPPRSAPIRYDVQVSRDLTEAKLLSTKDGLETVLGALGAFLKNPRASERSLELVRRGTLAALTRAARDPTAVALDLFRENAYSGHPYAHTAVGSEAELRAVTLDDVERFIDRHMRPDRAVLAIVGDVEPAGMVRLTGDLLGDWQGRQDPESDTAVDGSVARARTGGEFVRLLDARRSRVIVGVPGPAVTDPEFEELRMLGTAITVLGFEDIVFQRRAALSVRTLPEGFRERGSMAIEVVAPHLRRDEAVFDVQRLMRRLTLEQLDAQDLKDFDRVRAGRDAGGIQGVLSLASHLGYREAAGLGALSYRSALETSPSLPTPARLKAVAGKYLRPEAWIVVKVGPPSL